MLKLEQRTADYLAVLRDQRRLSPHTVAATRRDLDCFVAFLAERSLDVHSVRQFVMDQNRRGKQPASLHRYLSSLCLLYTSPSPRDLSTSRMPSSA